MTTASRAPDPDGDGTARPASQTLDRGLRTLELVAGSERPLSVAASPKLR